MAGSFSDKTWSGTPLWQISEELEAQRKKREEAERRKATTPVAVLHIRVEGEHFRSELTLFIPVVVDGKAAGSFREVSVRGPRRKSRQEAVKDGFVLREGFHDAGEAEVRRKQQELQTKVWESHELPPENASVEEDADQEQRLRLAQRPRGTGWTRQKDAEFFVHSHAPMAYDPKKRKYFTKEPTSQRYVDCEPPHDPVEYPLSISAGASLVGREEGDLTRAERPRTLLLKELIKTGVAMKKPLFFLDQPASCFALFEGVRGSAAVEHCARNFHVKLLAKLSSSLQYWSDAMMEGLLRGILEELDAELLQQQSTCYDGVSVGVAIVLGDRLTVATLGSVRGLLLAPGSAPQVIGGSHRVLEEGQERQRIDAASGEVTLGDGSVAGRLLVRRPMPAREVAIAQDQLAEISRVLDAGPDSFAALGFCADDTVDAKSAKAQYRRLALRVHPDKAPAEAKDRAKDAFSKIEKAAERIEDLYEASADAANALHQLLAKAGTINATVMPRSWALSLLGMQLEEGQYVEDIREAAEKKVEELKKNFMKLGQFADGSPAHADQVRAIELLDEALEVLSAPIPKESVLSAVPVTRALGLRDLKKPRPIITAVPDMHVVQVERAGSHHFALLSSAVSALSNDEIVKRIRQFPRQPKVASLVIAQDATTCSSRGGSSSSTAPAACMVSVLEVGQVVQERAEAQAALKKARKEEPTEKKVRCLHILLKHKELKMNMDLSSQLRLKGKGPVTRSQAQAEQELLTMLRSLVDNPNTFHVLARKHSECDTAIQPGQNAGDLGWTTRGSLGLPTVEDAMFNLGVYEISDIVASPRGLHIIQRVG